MTDCTEIPVRSDQTPVLYVADYENPIWYIYMIYHYLSDRYIYMLINMYGIHV